MYVLLKYNYFTMQSIPSPWYGTLRTHLTSLCLMTSSLSSLTLPPSTSPTPATRRSTVAASRGREGGSEGGRDGGRKRGRKRGREKVREEAREGGRKRGREGGREIHNNKSQLIIQNLLYSFTKFYLCSFVSRKCVGLLAYIQDVYTC